ncbi:MAG: MmgE/PrpD family protein [Peptococcaceae bacterium]
MKDLTLSLTENIINFPLNFIPEEAILESKRSFLNWLGAAIGATKHPSVEMLLELAAEIGGPPQATILGRNIKTDMQFASLINGMSSHIFDFDDTFLNTVLHPSAPVWPAILAVAENKNLPTKDVLAAFVIGCEVEQRIALAICPAHYERGWHVTGTTGTFGAAAAAGRLLELDHLQMTNALGLAAAQPTGLREMFGTMTKPFHPGKAAANGLLSALLAQKGFTSSLAPLEAKRGYGQVLSENPNFAVIDEPWGNKWHIMNNSYKPFACGIVTHPGIEAGINLKNFHNINPADIAEILIEVHPLVLELTGKETPKNQLEAKFSIYHCVAAGIIFGKAGEAQFADNIVLREDVLTLRKKITAEINNALKEDQTILHVKLKNGRTIEITVEHVIGSKDKPMTNSDLEEKFIELTSGILRGNEKNLIAKIWQMEKNLSIQEITRLSHSPE